MYLKIHESYRNVVALADEDLVGKVFEEGKLQLDVRENFYNGTKVDEEKAIQILESQALDDSTFNIVGKESISTALKAKIISEDNIGKIQDIPFALTLI